MWTPRHRLLLCHLLGGIHPHALQPRRTLTAVEQASAGPPRILPGSACRNVADEIPWKATATEGLFLRHWQLTKSLGIQTTRATDDRCCCDMGCAMTLEKGLIRHDNCTLTIHLWTWFYRRLDPQPTPEQRADIGDGSLLARASHRDGQLFRPAYAATAVRGSATAPGAADAGARYGAAAGRDPAYAIMAPRRTVGMRPRPVRRIAQRTADHGLSMQVSSASAMVEIWLLRHVNSGLLGDLRRRARYRRAAESIRPSPAAKVASARMRHPRHEPGTGRCRRHRPRCRSVPMSRARTQCPTSPDRAIDHVEVAEQPPGGGGAIRDAHGQGHAQARSWCAATRGRWSASIRRTEERRARRCRRLRTARAAPSSSRPRPPPPRRSSEERRPRAAAGGNRRPARLAHRH